MSVNNPYKFAIIILSLVLMGVMVVTNKAEWNDLDQYFALIVGYGIGNGVAAKRGQPSEPVFSPKEPA